MLDELQEWASLKQHLSDESNNAPVLNNSFFRRIITILEDDSAGTGDILTAYRDALKASPDPSAELFFNQASSHLNQFKPISEQQFISAGLIYNSFKNSLKLNKQKTKLGLEQIDKVYKLEKRRHISKIPIDTTLANKLFPESPNDENLGHYRGKGQQAAIRTALQSQPGSTIIVNLPTGTGKTLVTHSLCLFSSTEKLTLVITPTTSLAMEQADRAEKMLNLAGEKTHNCYYFGSGQTPQQRQDIKDRIRSGQQRILFTSPESARGALLPSLFDAAKDQKLANIIVDEAHIIDQWGDEFRPDFQIFAAVSHALINESRRTIKCVLLSATFTDTNLATLRSLFNFDSHGFIEVHNSFLRPEPQYQVKELNETDDFHQTLEQALIELPRPLIVYALERSKAKSAESFIKSLGYTRVQCFTGETSSDSRAKLIQQWNNDELDIMVATSAFGVGMDKENVRSILHIQPPENIDRFYQEVGRSGRDGRASQSLVVFEKRDLYESKKINTSTLISVQIGLKRWTSLFNHRLNSNESNVINITNMHEGIDQNSNANESWNWRTLLLMQRSGMIEIEFKRPEHPPSWTEEQNSFNFGHQEKKFYENYYQQIQINTLVDNHREEACWEKYVGRQRAIEPKRREEGFKRLATWLLNPKDVSLCNSLSEQYRINGYAPQITCGGCPNCRQKGYLHGQFPTLNFEPIVNKPDYVHQSAKYIYYPTDQTTTIRKLIRGWALWIESLISKHQIETVYSSPEMVKRLSKTLPSGMKKFWANDYISQGKPLVITEASLIIVPADHTTIPEIDSDNVPYILLAPKNLQSPRHLGRTWWDDYPIAQSIDHFLTSTN